MRVRAAVAFVAAGWFLAAGCSDEAPAPSVAPPTAPSPSAAAPRAPAPQPPAPVRTDLGVVSGVVDKGQPAMPDVQRRVVLLRAGAQVAETKTDAFGAYSFAGVEPGVAHEVRIEGEGVATTRLTGIVLVARERRDVGTTLVGPPGRLVVTVTDDRGAPIEGASVDVFRAPEGALAELVGRLDAGASAAPAASAPTDAKGRASFEVPKDASWSVAARAPGRARETDVRIGFGQDTDERSVELSLPPAETLRGRVLDDAGRPVAAACVAARREPPISPGEHGARDEGPAQWQRTIADADGKFAFDALPPGAVELAVWRAGGSPIDAATVAVPEVKEVDLVLPATATLSGRVTDADTGAPVPGVVVAAGVPGSGWERRPFARIATSDADGRWVLDQLPPRTAIAPDVVIPAPWAHSRFDGPGGIVLRDGESRTADFKVRRGASVSGRVTCDGSPVAGADVEVITFAPGWDWVIGGTDVRADADGRFAAEGVLPGPAVVFAVAPGDDSYQARDALIKTVKKDASARERIVFEIASGTALQRDVAITRTPKDESRFEAMDREMNAGRREIRVHGRVTTSDGVPLLRARLAVDGGRFGRMAREFARDLGPEGTYEARCSLDAKEHTVTVWAIDARHGEAALADVQVPDGATELKIDVVLPALVPVRGRVVSGEEPVAGAAIRRQGADVTRSAADGSFEVALAPGTGSLTVIARGFITKRVDKIEVPHDGELSVELAAAQSVAGTVVDESGKPVAGIVVVPVDFEDDVIAPYSGRSADDVAIPPITGADGAFRLEGLAPGRCRLRAASGPGAAAQIAVTTTDAFETGTSDAQVVVAPGVRVAGRVLDADGKPVFRARIECVPVDEDGERHRAQARKAESGVTGEFAFEGLAAGRHDFDVAPRYGMQLAPARRRVSGGAEDVAISLERAGVIAGVVVTPEGKPFQRCSLELSRLDEAPDDEPSWPDELDCEWTENDASFRILVPPRSRYRVTFSRSGNARERALLTGGDDVAAGTTDLRLVAVSGLRVGGTVVDPEGAALAGAQVEVCTPDGVDRRARTGADGAFEVGGIASATKTHVTVTLDGRIPARIADVAAGTRDLRVVLTPGLSISGRLLDAAGKVPRNWQVRALNPSEPSVDLWRATVDDRGDFEVRGLPEGEWVLEAIIPGCMTLTDQAALGTFRAGTRDLDLRLPKRP